MEENTKFLQQPKNTILTKLPSGSDEFGRGQRCPWNRIFVLCLALVHVGTVLTLVWVSGRLSVLEDEVAGWGSRVEPGLTRVKRRIEQGRPPQNTPSNRPHLGSAHVEFMYPKGGEDPDRSRSTATDPSLPNNNTDSVLLTSYSRIPIFFAIAQLFMLPAEMSQAAVVDKAAMIQHLRTGTGILKAAATKRNGTSETKAEDRIFFKPYKFPYWGLPYGMYSDGGFFNPGLFPFVPGGPGFPPMDGIFGGPFGPGDFPGGGPTPFQGPGNSTMDMMGSSRFAAEKKSKKRPRRRKCKKNCSRRNKYSSTTPQPSAPSANMYPSPAGRNMYPPQGKNQYPPPTGNRYPPPPPQYNNGHMQRQPTYSRPQPNYRNQPQYRPYRRRPASTQPTTTAAPKYAPAAPYPPITIQNFYSHSAPPPASVATYQSPFPEPPSPHVFYNQYLYPEQEDANEGHSPDYEPESIDEQENDSEEEADVYTKTEQPYSTTTTYTTPNPPHSVATSTTTPNPNYGSSAVPASAYYTTPAPTPPPSYLYKPETTTAGTPYQSPYLYPTPTMSTTTPRPQANYFISQDPQSYTPGQGYNQQPQPNYAKNIKPNLYVSTTTLPAQYNAEASTRTTPKYAQYNQPQPQANYSVSATPVPYPPRTPQPPYVRVEGTTTTTPSSAQPAYQHQYLSPTTTPRPQIYYSSSQRPNTAPPLYYQPQPEFPYGIQQAASPSQAYLYSSTLPPTTYTTALPQTYYSIYGSQSQQMAAQSYNQQRSQYSTNGNQAAHYKESAKAPVATYGTTTEPPTISSYSFSMVPLTTPLPQTHYSAAPLTSNAYNPNYNQVQSRGNYNLQYTKETVPLQYNTAFDYNGPSSADNNGYPAPSIQLDYNSQFQNPSYYQEQWSPASSNQYQSEMQWSSPSSTKYKYTAAEPWSTRTTEQVADVNGPQQQTHAKQASKDAHVNAFLSDYYRRTVHNHNEQNRGHLYQHNTEIGPVKTDFSVSATTTTTTTTPPTTSTTTTSTLPTTTTISRSTPPTTTVITRKRFRPSELTTLTADLPTESSIIAMPAPSPARNGSNFSAVLYSTQNQMGSVSQSEIRSQDQHLGRPRMPPFKSKPFRVRRVKARKATTTIEPPPEITTTAATIQQAPDTTISKTSKLEAEVTVLPITVPVQRFVESRAPVVQAELEITPNPQNQILQNTNAGIRYYNIRTGQSTFELPGDDGWSG